MGMDSVGVGVAWRSNVWNSNLTIAAGNIFRVNGSFVTGQIYSTSTDLTIYNSAGTDFGLLRFGGITNAFPALKRNSNFLQVRLADDSTNAAIQAANIVSSGKFFGLAGSSLDLLTDGKAVLQNTAGTDFTLLQFGGSTSSFPALKRNGPGLNVRLADDSAYSFIVASVLVAAGSAFGVSAGQVCIGGSTATTVGAAGGASALPATPLGYINVNVGGTAAKIPYYNN